jgi:hypothetical protein
MSVGNERSPEVYSSSTVDATVDLFMTASMLLPSDTALTKRSKNAPSPPTMSIFALANAAPSTLACSLAIFAWMLRPSS